MACEVSDAVMTGDRHQGLVALRNRLAAAVDEATPRDLPALVLRLTDVMGQLGEIAEGASPIDEVNARRAARRAQTQPGKEAPGQPG